MSGRRKKLHRSERYAVPILMLEIAATPTVGIEPREFLTSVSPTSSAAAPTPWEACTGARPAVGR
jgi:hypothetical protein